MHVQLKRLRQQKKLRLRQQKLLQRKQQRHRLSKPIWIT